jgi:hypothetical protein
MNIRYLAELRVESEKYFNPRRTAQTAQTRDSDYLQFVQSAPPQEEPEFSGSTTHCRWTVRFPNLPAIEVAITPAATSEAVLALYPGAGASWRC